MAKQTAAKNRRRQSSGGDQILEPSEPIVQAQPAAQKRRAWSVAALTAVAIFLAIYWLRIDHVFGLIVDDAWYVLLAKALATGQGYTLINSPTPGITPFYAPAFPALLSIFYRISPNFPANLWLLKLVSMAGVGWLTFINFNRECELPKYVSLGLALATTIYPALVFLATSSVMSECVYTLLLVAAVLLIERAVRDGKMGWGLKYLLPAGGLAGLAVLTRPVGLGLIAAAIIYLLKERLPRQALILVAGIAVLVGPWMIYSRRHAPTPAQRAEQGANIVQPYEKQFWQRTPGQPLSGTITAEDLPERIWNNLSEIAKYDFGGLAFYSLFRPLEPGERIRIGSEGRMVSFAVLALALAGYIFVVFFVRRRLTLAELVVPLSFGVTLLWGWEQYRLMLPLVPFLLFYILMGAVALAFGYQTLAVDKTGRAQVITMHVAAWMFALVNLYGNYKYIDKKYDPVPEYRLQWIRSFDENASFINRSAEIAAKDAVIATQNPALFHLLSGRKTVALDDPAGSWETWNRVGVRYIARTSPFQLPPPEPAESKYSTVYRQGGSLNLRLVDLGDPSSRPVWGTKD